MLSTSKLYTFLATLMRYPSHEMDSYTAAIDKILTGLPLPENHHWKKELATFFSGEDWLQQLQLEYTRLFINDKTGPCAPLYGSVYLDGSLMGASAEAVKAFYRETGFGFEATGELPDHLCAELYFLAFLSSLEMQDEEIHFLKTFFHPWFIKLSRKVDASAGLFFYPMIMSFINILTSSEDE